MSTPDKTQSQTSWQERLATWIGQSTDDQESIHQIGQIQSYGCLLVLDITAQPQIVQASSNTARFLGIAPDQLIGQSLAKIMTAPTVAKITAAIAQSDNSTIECQLKHHHSQPSSANLALGGELNPSGSLWLLELEPLAPIPISSQQLRSQYHRLTETILQIRQTQELQDLCNVVCQEVATLTGYDRVMVYEFGPDQTGIVRAEVVQGQRDSYLGLHYPAVDIPAPARSLFCQKTVRLIQDVTTEPIHLWQDDQGLHPHQVDLTRSTLRSPKACHRQYLQNMGVCASLTLALVDQNGLWGLIACHHDQPRWLDSELRKICELIAQFVVSELLLRQSQAFSHYQTQIHDIEDQIYRELEQAPSHAMQILRQHRHQLQALIPADGVVIRVDQSLESVGAAPTPEELWPLLTWAIAEYQSGLYHTDVLRQDYPDAAAYALPFAGVCILSVVLERFVYQVAWLRLEQAYIVNWGGNPQEMFDLETDSPRGSQQLMTLSPRTSFALWQECVQGRSLPWQPMELQAARGIRNSLLLTALNQSHHLLQEAIKRVEQASTTKDEFLANMSHEIRTPMNAILGFTQLLEITPLNPKQQAYIHSINHGGEQLLGIINDILDLAKLKSGELALNQSPFYLPSLLDNLRQLFLPSIQAAALDIHIEIATDVPRWVTGPLQRLEQVLTNLIRNAIKFTETGQIKLQVRRAQPKSELLSYHHSPSKILIYFAVEDTGIGIAPADQARIFETFTQVDSSINRRYEGTGLGLAICQEIIQVMAGEIGVESELGVGSRFWFTVPLTVTAHEAAESSHSAIAKNLLVPSIGDILLVEDNDLNKELTIEMFTALGLTLDHVGDGQAALAHMQQQTYALVLMDCHLPKMNGYDATRQFRDWAAQSNAPRTVIIGITAYAMTGDREKCLQAGMDDYLSKPFKLADIQALLLKWFA